MALQTRRLNSLGIAREDDAAKGTAVALSTGHTMVVSSGILQSDYEYAMIDGINGKSLKGIEQHLVQKVSKLSFSADVKSDWIGHVLVGLLGTVATATVEGVIEHTITVLNGGNMPAYTFFNLDGVQNDRATYGTFNKVTLKCSPNSLLTADVEAFGQKIEDGSGSAAHATDHHFQGSHCTVKIATAQTNLTAAAGIAFSSLELEIEREITPIYGFVTATHTDPAEPINFVGGALMIRGRLEIPWEAETYRDYHFQETDKAMRIDFQDTGTTIGTNNPGMQIDIAKFNVIKHSRPEGPDDPDIEVLEFEGVYDLDDGNLNDISVVLTNEEAATAYTEPA